MGRLGHQDPGEFPEEVKSLFEKAVEYYEENMVLMVEIQVYSVIHSFMHFLSIHPESDHTCI
jgi:predicted Zn-dependent protease with MMP-like domain